MRTKQELTLEESAPDIHGNPATYLTKKTPLYDKNGRVTGLLGVSTDITDLKKTEFLSSIYFQNILDVLPENFYWTNRDGIILGCNNNQAKFFGFQSSENAIGKSIYGMKSHENSAETMKKNHLKVMRTRVPIKVEETCLVDGHTRTFLSYKNPLINNKKQVMGVFGVTVDITEQKELENALRVAKEKAEEISRMKSEFIHNMEHDIRTPFAGIYGMSLALAMQETQEEKKEALTMIANSSKELLEYASHILAFAQVEEEFNQVLSKKFSLHKLVQSVTSMELPPAKNKGLELSYEIANNIPETLIGDPDRVKGILINLISNAIKFTEKGSVFINIELVKKTKNNIILAFEVKDTGIGIPKEKQKSIYEKFFRINPTNQGIYKGFGLGLKIVKKFIEELNGEIDLESTPGEGTTFTFALSFDLPF
jgi:two-component system aerobic respiration control sensor histidine kinase ArcB